VPGSSSTVFQTKALLDDFWQQVPAFPCGFYLLKVQLHFQRYVKSPHFGGTWTDSYVPGDGAEWRQKESPKQSKSQFI